MTASKNGLVIQGFLGLGATQFDLGFPTPTTAGSCRLPDPVGYSAPVNSEVKLNVNSFGGVPTLADRPDRSSKP